MKQNGNNKSNTGKNKLTSIGEVGEFGLIERLTKHARLRNPSSIMGVGDDAAVLKHNNLLTVASTDLLVEGIHFDLVYTPLKHLGYKAVIVNLSDIYAMNAEPRQITVSLAVSSKFSVEALEQLYDGIHTACRHYNVDLVGGDTTSSKIGMVISITALGLAEPNKIAYRKGAKAGDYICVSGDLGAAYLGLQLLEREKLVFLEQPEAKTDLEGQDYLVGRFLKPEARRDIVELLESHDIIPTSMIDISDGLSSELLHICGQSNVGCRIFEENIPFHNDTIDMARKFEVNPLTCALNGGEDYELLFTVSPDVFDALENLHGISIIGRITEAAQGCNLFTKSGKQYPVEAQGWRHA